MKKQKKAWTLNTVFKVTRRCSIVFAAWVFFWCVVVLFSPETVKYIGVGMILLGFAFLIVAGIWCMKRWKCPSCGYNLGRRNWVFPEYCSSCGEKLDPDAPIDVK